MSVIASGTPLYSFSINSRDSNFYEIPHHQKNIEDFRHPLLSAKRNEIEERAELFELMDDEEQNIKQLMDQIHKGRYSDLEEGSPYFDELRYYPASNGLHVNEGHV